MYKPEEETEKKEELPILKPWMISILQNLASAEYQKRLSEGALGNAMKIVAKEKGFDAAKEMEKEVRENGFTSVGQIWAIQKKLDEISLFYQNEFDKGSILRSKINK